MKRTTFLTIFLLITLDAIFAQSYNPFPGTWEYTLKASDGNMHVVKVDSADSSGVNPVIFFNGILRPLDTVVFNCWGSPILSPIGPGPNIFGYSMTTLPGGEYEFQGPGTETFLIKTQLPLDTKWKVNSISNDSAWIDTILHVPIFGGSDSVMVIESDSGMSFSISKSNGIYEGLPLWPIGDLDYCSTWRPFTDFELVGIKDLGLGINRPGFEEIFAFNIGDELSTYEYLGFGGSGWRKEYEDFRIIMNDQDPDPNRFSYPVLRDFHQIEDVPPADPDTLPLTRDTTDLVFSRDSFPELEVLPYNKATIREGLNIAYLVSSPDVPGGVKLLYYHYPIWGDTCSGTFDIDCSGSSYFSTRYFAGGAGMINDDYSYFGVGGTSYSYEVSCMNKSGTIWPPGDTCDIFGPLSIHPETSGIFNVFPNPVKENIRIQSDAFAGKKLKYQIINTMGSQVRKGSIQIDATGISDFLDLSSYPNGVYILQLEPATNSTTSIRLLKQ